jgi:hypothetical protein
VAQINKDNLASFSKLQLFALRGIALHEKMLLLPALPAALLLVSPVFI